MIAVFFCIASLLIIGNAMVADKGKETARNRLLTGFFRFLLTPIEAVTSLKPVFFLGTYSWFYSCILEYHANPDRRDREAYILLRVG